MKKFYGTRRKAGVVVIKKRVSSHAFADDLFKFAGPDRHFIGLVLDELVPSLGFALHTFAIADETDIEKVAGDEVQSPGKYINARHPSLGDEYKGDGVFAQKFEKIPTDPGFVANLQGEFKIPR